MAGMKSSAAAKGGPARRASARSVRDGRLASFAQGLPGDTGRPGLWTLAVLHGVSGPDRSCPGASEDEALGILGQWEKAEAWVVAQKLAVLRELAARYPAPGEDEHDELAREVSLMLGVSIPAARKLSEFAMALGDRLPGIGRALEAGLLSAGKARMICEEASVLDDPGQLARAEEMILAGLAGCATYMALQRLVQRVVCTVDPEGARKRREQEEREHARVRFWREAAGTCGLMGTGLPADEALAAHAQVEGRAQEYRAAGVKRRIEILRVAAYLDLLNGVPAEQRVARFAAEDAAHAGAAEPGKPDRTEGRTGPATASQPDDGAGDSAADGGRPGNGAGGAAADGGRPGNGAGGGAADGGRPGNGAGGGAADGGRPGNGAGGGAADGGGPWDHVPAETPCAGCDDTACPCNTWPAEAPCESCAYAPCRCGSDPASDDDQPRPGRQGGERNGGGSRGGAGPGSGDRGTGAPGTSAPGGGSAADPGSGFAGRVNLTLAELDIPLLTALGLLRRPGEARGLGALDPALARTLAETAARNPASTFCFTIVNQDGHATGHGCLKPARATQRKKQQPTGPPGRHPGDSPSPSDAFIIAPRGRAGPPGGYGSWTLTLPGRAGQYTVDLHPVPTGDCDHRHESARHDPGQLLRHLVAVRDGKCGFPACSRHARESDFEHCVPYEQGGKTCGCNCWSCSRSCHQLKQSKRWTVTQPKPGFHQWTTPSGRTYTQEPWRYPA